MSKRLWVILSIITASTVLIFDQLSESNYRLTIFTTLGLIVVYLVKVFAEDYVKFYLKRVFKTLGIVRKHVEVNISEVNLERLKDRLEGQVKNICEEYLDDLRKGEIPVIKDLNWEYVRKSKDSSVHTGSLKEVFEKTNKRKYQSFVIVGEAGVGKTSSFYQYILDIIDDRSSLEKEPIPVYLPLDNWSSEIGFNDWVASTISKLYGIEKQLANLLIEGSHLILFLDGLDQMAEASRKLVFMDLLEFTKLSGTVALTSRSNGLLGFNSDQNGEIIGFNSFLSEYKLLPLRSEQVLKIVKNLDSRTDIEKVITASPMLKSFIRYPMALFLFSKVSVELNNEEIRSLEKGNDLDTFSKLWKKYDHLQFSGNNTATPQLRYTADKCRSWLKRMSLGSSDQFFIEALQPSYITRRSDKFLYYLTSRVISTLVLSIAIGFFLSAPFEYFGSGIVMGLTVTMVHILIIKYHFTKRLSALPYKLDHLTINFFYGIPVAMSLILYFGFSTPRLEDGMLLNGLFAPTQGNIGIFMSLFAGTVYGQRAIWQNLDLDIKPVENIVYDWKQFFKFGAIGGISVGLILMLAVIFIDQFFRSSAFAIWINGNSYNLDIRIFAFIAGLICGFPLIGMIGSFRRNTLIDFKEKQKSNIKPNHGIKYSLINAIKAGTIASFFLCIAFGSFFGFMSGEFTNLIKGVKAGFGGGLLVFLWFGGLEVVQHYTLRLIIFLRGYGPWSFSAFFLDLSKARFIKSVGASFSFIHPTIKGYFVQTDYNSTARPNRTMNVLVITVASVIMLYHVMTPFYLRFSQPHFWQNPYGFTFIDIPPFARQVDDNKVVFLNGIDQEVVEITASGNVSVGAFVGNTTPGGTEAGFMGFKIDDVYDYDTALTAEFSHAALLMKNTKNAHWKNFGKDNFFNTLNSSRSLRVPVSYGDTLEFIVNDKEYHNNHNTFDIMIEKSQRTQLVSHRGAAGLAPENTLEAIQIAIDLGVDMIEIDVRQTADSTLILMHDSDIDRTTNGQGQVSSFLWNDLKKLSIHHDMPEHGKILIPDLESTLDLLKNTDINLLIELKEPSSYPGLAEKLASLVKRKEMMDQVYIFSFDKEYIKQFKADYTNFKVGIFDFQPFTLKTFPELDAVGIHYLGLLVYPKFIKKMRNQGIKVLVWNVNHEPIMKLMINEEVDGLITDYPDKLKRIIGVDVSE
ncbi:MAG: glycerophosphodiester phosphodiesterase family protein [Cyclobacteriaceae bacterium]